MESFDERYPEIQEIIKKSLYRWKLKAMPSVGEEDIAQELLIHVHKKWYKYDAKRPLKQWLSRIIYNKMNNILRDYYYRDERPCLSCDLNEGAELCRKYGIQCSDCPLYAKWESSKKNAHNVKLPVTIESHLDEVHSQSSDALDWDKEIKEIKDKCKLFLSKNEYVVFEMFYFQNKTEIEIAQELGFKVGRTNNQRQVKILKKSLFEKLKNNLLKECQKPFTL